MPRRLPYLPALDGLRAIAVTMVFAYHLDLSWAAGGFLGVDVFFVISGYLITRLLLDEHTDDGRISLGNFWTRRFRRLVPAMVVMIAATLLATHRWGLPEQWSSIRLDAIAALGYVANWRFILDDQSYFEASLGPSPLLHTWSLAVEEQWYLLWPIAMAGLCLWAARHPRARRQVTAFVLVAALASAVWMAVLFDPSDPSRVYFGTDTRAQQLLVGAALAWILETAPSFARAARAPRMRWLFAVALAALVALGVVVEDDATWLYRGGLLAVSALAALVVLGTTIERGSALGWLGWGPLVWVGRRSYGIYLWHWPVIVFLDPATGGDLGRWQLVALQIALTLAAAEASHRLVETPVRRSTARPVRTVALWSGAALTVGAVGLVWLVPPATRDLGRSDAAFPELDELLSPPAPAPDSTVERPGEADSGPSDTRATDPAPADTRRVLLFGDSAAYTLAEQFELPPGERWDVQALAKLGCPITPGVTIDPGSSRPNPVDAECTDWVGLWPEYVRVLEPDIVVVMVGAWEVLDHRIDGTEIRFPSDQWYGVVRDALSEAVAAASTSGAPVVVLDVPCMQPRPGSTARADPARLEAVNELIRQVADAGTTGDVSVLALSEVICPDGDDDLVVEGVPARYDGVHYTRPGAALVWPWLLDELGRVLDSAGPTAADQMPG